MDQQTSTARFKALFVCVYAVKFPNFTNGISSHATKVRNLRTKLLSEQKWLAFIAIFVTTFQQRKPAA